MFTYVFADFPYWDEWTENPTADAWQIARDQTTQDQWVLDRVLHNFGIWDHTQDDWSAINYIQTVVNFFLILVSFIALLVLIYWFYLMFFGEHEETFQKAKKYVINSSIALLVMWTSWFIVSFILYIVSLWVWS